MRKIKMKDVIIERTFQGIRLSYWEDDCVTRYSQYYIGYTLAEAKSRFREYLANAMVRDRAMQNISREDLTTPDKVLCNALLCITRGDMAMARHLLGSRPG